MKKIFIVLLLCVIHFAYPKSSSLKVVLDWFVNPDEAPLLVAQQFGFFKKQGLQVQLISPSNVTDGPKFVAVGHADIAVSYQTTLLSQVSEGLPLIRIGTLINHPLNCLMVLKNGPIKKIADLKGKSVAYSSTGFNSVVLATMLQYHHLSLKDVDSINVNYNLVQALLSKRVDAFVGGYRNVEKIELSLAGQPAKCFKPENNGVPSYDALIFVANKEKLHDAKLRKFLLAISQATTFLSQHPNATFAKIRKAYPSMNSRFNRVSWLASIPYFDRHPAKLNKERYQQFAEFMKEQGFLKAIPPLSSYAVDLFSTNK